MHSLHRAQLALAGLDSLSSPAGAVLRLVEITLNEAPSLDDIAALVRTDPGLAVEVLRRQPQESLKRRNALNIPNAVRALGVDGLRELALRSELRGALDIFDAEDGAVCSLSARKHAVACAGVTGALAAELGREDPESAHAAGLLASIGSLALWDLFEGRLNELRPRMAGQGVQHAIEVERQAFGVDHENLGIVIAEGWGLPTELADVLGAAYRSAEQLERLARTGVDTELATLVRVGFHVAHRAGFPLFGAVRLDEPPRDVVEMLARSDADRLVRRAREAVSEAAALARPLARSVREGFESMRRTQSELRERLLAAERLLRAEESVNKVLKYGLNRLGDGDPLPGVMFRAMESMGFHRIACLEIDSAAAKLEVVGAAAASGHQKVGEGVWLPFPVDAPQLVEPAIVTRQDRAPSHQLVLELIGAGSAVVASLRSLEPGKRLLLAADYGPTGRAPTPGEERCLGIIAEQLTLLLQFEQLTKEKERMATQDPLTGAATRRRLMDRLEYSMTQTARTKLPFSLLIMDLDHFKKFNDTMGHQVGDRLLQDLVNVLGANVRKGDLVARYGGEEFVVLLPNCGLDDAVAVAEDLRNAVYDYGVERREDYQGLKVSVSIGAAEWRVGETALALIGRADAALYESKHGGRNRVTSAAAAA